MRSIYFILGFFKINLLLIYFLNQLFSLQKWPKDPGLGMNCVSHTTDVKLGYSVTLKKSLFPVNSKNIPIKEQSIVIQNLKSLLNHGTHKPGLHFTTKNELAARQWHMPTHTALCALDSYSRNTELKEFKVSSMLHFQENTLLK